MPNADDELTEVERLRNALAMARSHMRVVLTSPVCHPHNAITLRDAITRIDRTLSDDAPSVEPDDDTDDALRPEGAR